MLGYPIFGLQENEPEKVLTFVYEYSQGKHTFKWNSSAYEKDEYGNLGN